MKQLQQLCMLALLLIFTASCSQLVHTDYKLMDKGQVATIDTLKQCITIHSFSNNKENSWSVSRPYQDKLSLWGIQYTGKICLGDTVNIYQDGTDFFATKYDVKDAQNINQTLVSYYWKHLADHWLLYLFIFTILGILGSGILKHLTKKDMDDLFFLCLLFCLGACYGNSNVGKRLHPTQSGTITEITPTYITLDNTFTTPYATLNDISTQKSVKVGQHVTFYAYCESNDFANFFPSTHKLNEKALKATQSYPEIWLMTLVFFFVATLLSQVPFAVLNRLIRRKRKQNTEKAP